MTDLLLVAAGAAVGAPLRYLTDRTVQSRHDTVFPWGTFAVNIAGAFILGLLSGLGGRHLHLLLGTGLCGALSTYSTFSYETLRLAASGSRLFAAANVAASLTAGLGAAFLGAAVGAALS